MKKCIKLVLINLLILSALCINILSGEEKGKAGVTLPILNYIAGTRALGLGSAYTAMSDEITSMYWNPAGLARLTRQQVYILGEKLYLGSTYLFGGYSIPFYGIGVFGVGLIFLTTGDIQGYDPLGAPTEFFSDTQTMLILSYGSPLDNIKKLKSRHFRFLDVGASLKIIKHSIYEYSAYGIAMDIGAKYVPLKTTPILRDFIFGLVMQNFIPPGLKLKEKREWYPLKVKFGTVYRTLYDALYLTVDINQILFRKQQTEINAGVEYWPVHLDPVIGKIFRLRMGYKKGITGGMGIEIEDFTFDYGMSYNDIWGFIHQFSASFRFGKPRYK